MSEDKDAERIVSMRLRGAAVAKEQPQINGAEVAGEQKVIKPGGGIKSAGPSAKPRYVINAKPKASATPEPEPPSIDTDEIRGAEAPRVLDPDASTEIAAAFVRHCYRRDANSVLRFWQGMFYHWNGSFYEELEHEILRGQVREFLYNAKRRVAKGALEPFNPKRFHINEVLDAMQSGVIVPGRSPTPMWLDTLEPAKGMVAFRNAVVNIHTGQAQPHTHRLWLHSARPFDWDPTAEAVVWQGVLDSYWPGDVEAQDFVEEWLGYCMTEETWAQKGAMFIGPRRSGKSTIAYVLRRLVGEKSYVGLSFDTWTRGENSNQPMLGKQVGVFADVRLKPARQYGQSYDPGGLSHVSQGLLLQIIGEDTITVGRKYVGPWEGQLPIKLVLISNVVPNLNDGSGALSGRFVKLRFNHSFFDNEDTALRDKLDAELPGIAARCVAAYARLRRRGRFMQPASASLLEAEVVAASDPWSAMSAECFELSPIGDLQQTAGPQHFHDVVRGQRPP
jgi:putative DNA primase/helicase